MIAVVFFLLICTVELQKFLNDSHRNGKNISVHIFVDFVKEVKYLHLVHCKETFFEEHSEHECSHTCPS